ncbi:HXXEE domain-containing protein [Cellulomonas citrea]|uniref:HXXEE domain-containing protein n=1 Tax=Cellulomonas citrea TaxID=1909423 RepID=UPI00135C5274|nr:HXXEE domain-containing protein [Cellulomonas citrea]
MTGAPLPTSTRRALRALPVVWFVHDLEELATMSATSQHLPDRIGARLPWVPASVRDRVRTGPAEAAGAIALVGVLMVGTAELAVRRPGSRLARTFVEVETVGLGLHALSHVGASLVLRCYTTGVVTAPTVALPGAAVVATTLVDEGYTTWPRLLRAVRWLPALPAVAGLAHLGARWAAARWGTGGPAVAADVRGSSRDR